jgi:hypothetical protein
MAHLQVSLFLGGVSWPPQSTIHLIPGAVTQGAVIVQTDGAIICHDLSLRAAWRTRGRGDMNRGQGFNVMIFQGQIPTGGYTIPFQVQAPQAPWSYNGYYISITWELVVECNLGVFQKPNFTFPMLLRPA